MRSVDVLSSLDRPPFWWETIRGLPARGRRTKACQRTSPHLPWVRANCTFVPWVESRCLCIVACRALALFIARLARMRPQSRPSKPTRIRPILARAACRTAVRGERRGRVQHHEGSSSGELDATITPRPHRRHPASRRSRRGCRQSKRAARAPKGQLQELSRWRGWRASHAKQVSSPFAQSPAP